jgi:Bacterial PH domain
MPFPASFDRTAKIISGIVCLGLLAVVVGIHNLLADGIAFLVLMVSVAYSPRGYVISDGSILVKRLAGSVRIALDDVREVRRTGREDFRGCIRLWGSGGLFGYYGLFSTAKLGKSTWYVTNRSNGVVVITAAKTVLFSPDDPEGFLAALRAAAPVAEAYMGMTPEPARSFGSVGKLIAVAAAVAFLLLLAITFTYSPGVPGYTLTPDALTIHDRFYPVTLQASSVDVAQIRVIDLDRDRDWRPTMRTNGIATVHYHAGWFRVANGQTVRLYQANGQRVVLIPAKGDGPPILYQAADPEKFVNDIRAQWSRTAQSSAKAGKWIYYAL